MLNYNRRDLMTLIFVLESCSNGVMVMTKWVDGNRHGYFWLAYFVPFEWSL